MPSLSKVLSFCSFHLVGLGRRKPSGGAPPGVAGRTAEEEKKAAVAGEKVLADDSEAATCRLRNRAVTGLIDAMATETQVEKGEEVW